MEKKSTIFLGFSDEELYVLLVYLGVPAMEGVQLLEQRNLNEKQRNLLLGVAERALVAREVLLPTAQGEYKIADIPHALLRTCSNASRVLQIDCNVSSAKPLTYYYCHTHQMYVLHTHPAPYLHGFLALGDVKAFSQSAFAALELGEIAHLACPAGQLTKDIYLAARAAAQHSTADAIRVLSASALPAETAAAFAHSLHKPLFRHSLLFYEKDASDPERIEGFVLLKGENGLWMLNADEQDVLTITPLTIDEFSQRFSALFSGW